MNISENIDIQPSGSPTSLRPTAREAAAGRNRDEIPDARKWYALKVHFNRIVPVQDYLEGELADDDVRCFVPMHTVEKYTGGKLEYSREQLVKSLLFVLCTPETLSRTRAKFSGQVAPYFDSITGKPLVVPEKQMDGFIALCEMKDSGLEYLGKDEGKYHMGDKVRVTDGVFKGLEGHIKRIKHDRRLVVAIEGIAAFATGFIPPAFLEVIGQDERK